MNRGYSTDLTEIGPGTDFVREIEMRTPHHRCLKITFSINRSDSAKVPVDESAENALIPIRSLPTEQKDPQHFNANQRLQVPAGSERECGIEQKLDIWLVSVKHRRIGKPDTRIPSGAGTAKFETQQVQPFFAGGNSLIALSPGVRLAPCSTGNKSKHHPPHPLFVPSARNNVWTHIEKSLQISVRTEAGDQYG
ncbi:hypothetical protein SKAU_G00043940 [Synaphobranchus kaupii]|uniref:Uncharacterized protein n=1 Tax=Synaphobranchus kaupii TaxID=118154 RepID=A0A9Q1J6X1_SYNKA|nr:hypothetical protein SKAU_G00043940 [Synaphobranchus kaupii]